MLEYCISGNELAKEIFVIFAEIKVPRIQHRVNNSLKLDVTLKIN